MNSWIPRASAVKSTFNEDALTVQKAFEEYWATGGFPEVIGSGESRIKTHQEYFQAVLFRDLVSDTIFRT